MRNPYPGAASRVATAPGPFVRLQSRILAGPPTRDFAEPLDLHVRRLGSCPVGGVSVTRAIDKSGLVGRGGAAFPAAQKWRAIADQDHGGAVVVVNAHEGEPASRKDRTLLALRPHLVLDGAVVAAESVGATEVIVYTADTYTEVREALRCAIAERRDSGYSTMPISVVTAAHGYVAGEASAAVHKLNGGRATPVRIRPRESGVGGRPTLVHNAETLAHAALIARAGSAWFRQVGTPEVPGTALVTVGGAVRSPGTVVEAPLGATVAELVQAAGGWTLRPQAILFGGYAGVWLRAADVWSSPLGARGAPGVGASAACGILIVIPEGSCGFAEAAGVMSHLARVTAGNCGPCVHGLRAMAETTTRVVNGGGTRDDVRRLHELVDTVRGRGGCGHPDGAINQLVSALVTFAPHVDDHIRNGRCEGMRTPSYLPSRGWL